MKYSHFTQTNTWKNSNVFGLVLVTLSVLTLVSCGVGWKKYAVEEVSQVLYEEGLISSVDMNLVEYPGGIQEYNFVDRLTLPDYDGHIRIYPTRSVQRKVIRSTAKSMAKGGFTYSQFVKGNVVITIFPELSEEDAERFRRALDALE